MASDTKSRPATYSSFAKILHWLTALMVLSLIPVGLIMVRIKEGPLQDQLFALHEPFGFLVLVVVLLRLVTRAIYGSPAPSESLSQFERAASVSVHHLQYLALVVITMLGWAGMSAYGSGISMFGLFSVPAILPKNEALAEILFNAHFWAAMVLSVLLVAHIGGALMHYLIKKDGVMQRMLP